MGWRPATENYGFELFEVPRSADFYFYGSYGEQASVRADAGDGIAVECSPEDRGAVIEALSELLNLMKEAK